MRFVFASALLVLAFISTDVAACSCAPPGTLQQSRDQSTQVFLGRVISVEDRTPAMDKNWLTAVTDWVKQLFGADQPVSDQDFPYKRVSFLVTETFKGPSVSRIDVRTGLGGGDCGYSFDPGKEYVVYAYGEADTLRTGICSRTGLTSEPGAGLSILRNNTDEQ
jgi:hypothetical protein